VLSGASGALVVIDGCVVHWSDRNVSANSRHAYTVHVYDGTSDWSERNWSVNPERLICFSALVL